VSAKDDELRKWRSGRDVRVQLAARLAAAAVALHGWWLAFMCRHGLRSRQGTDCCGAARLLTLRRHCRTLSQETVLGPPVHYVRRRDVCEVALAARNRAREPVKWRAAVAALEGAKPARRGLHLLSPLFGSDTAPAPVTSLRLLVIRRARCSPSRCESSVIRERRRRPALPLLVDLI
jgi:hypothetical protein